MDSKTLYQLFTYVEKNWRPRRNGNPGPHNQIFQRILSGNKSADSIIREAHSLHVSLPDSNLWDKILTLRAEMQTIIKEKALPGMTLQKFDDVYQAAVWMKFLNVCYSWMISPDLKYLYRGVKHPKAKTYDIVPMIFRNLNKKEELMNRVKKVSSYVHQLREYFPQFSEDQLLALVQHYAEVAKIGTWFLDFTWDPYIALFFASVGGKDGELGQIFYVNRPQWDDYSANGQNILGKIKIIDIPNIHRIAAQRAVFLDTSHPELFKHYSAFSIWFDQKTNLVYEDPTHHPPITKEDLLPDKDNVIEILSNITPTPNVKIMEGFTKSKINFIYPLTVYDYMSIVFSWYNQEKNEESRKNFEYVIVIIDFYYRLLNAKNQARIFNQPSIHKLRNIFDLLKNPIQARNWREALEFSTYASLQKGDEHIYTEILNELEEETKNFTQYLKHKIDTYKKLYPNTYPQFDDLNYQK